MDELKGGQAAPALLFPRSARKLSQHELREHIASVVREWARSGATRSAFDPTPTAIVTVGEAERLLGARATRGSSGSPPPTMDTAHLLRAARQSVQSQLARVLDRADALLEEIRARSIAGEPIPSHIWEAHRCEEACNARLTVELWKGFLGELRRVKSYEDLRDFARSRASVFGELSEETALAEAEREIQVAPDDLYGEQTLGSPGRLVTATAGEIVRALQRARNALHGRIRERKAASEKPQGRPPSEISRLDREHVEASLRKGTSIRKLARAYEWTEAKVRRIQAEARKSGRL